MNGNALNPDIRIWLGDEKAVDASAIAAPLAMILSIAILLIAVKLQISMLVVAAGMTAALSLACHVWFALLRSRLVIALYQYIFVRWGNARINAIAPIRRRAVTLAKGAVASWVVAGMQALWLLSVKLAYMFPEALTIYAVVIVISCAHSTAFIYSRRALRLEVDHLRDIAPACEIQL